jgi:hypothetical protein
MMERGNGFTTRFAPSFGDGLVATSIQDEAKST